MAEIDWSSTKESLKGVAITGLVVNVAYNMELEMEKKTHRLFSDLKIQGLVLLGIQ